MIKRLAFLIALTFAMFSTDIFAQSTGTIQGAVTYAFTGDVACGAKIIVTSDSDGIKPEDRIERVTQTDCTGKYQFSSLPPGHYVVNVQTQSRWYSTLHSPGASVEVGRVVEVNLEIYTFIVGMLGLLGNGAILAFFVWLALRK